MKSTKKLLALLLALTLVLGLTGAALAESGSITITNAVKGQTYSFYRILDLESYDATAGTYSYKVATNWEDFFSGADINGVYVDVVGGYVTWHKNLVCSNKEEDHTHTDACYQDADPAAFAKAALEYARSNGIARNNYTQEGPKTVTVQALGYYLIDTNVGTLCSLTTTNPNATIEDKNHAPVPEKTVKEDSTGEYGESNTAQIGDTVEFKTVIHAKPGAQGYNLHDQMEAGLTLNKESISVKVDDTELTKVKDYNVAYDVPCKNSGGVNTVCDFEITFTETYLNTITENRDIVVTYNAVLNKFAEIADATNDNDTKLSYGENRDIDSTWDKTTTKTFMFDVIKTDSSLKVLNGAKFELYDASTGGNKIALVKESDGVYRVATTAEQNAQNFTSAVIEAGKATVKGLDAGSYWLEETAAPAGYNKLTGRVEVKIENANLTTTMTGDTWAQGNGGVQITNKAGTTLPTTGGMGTTLFYVLGSVLVLGAVVLLVSKKRMSKAE